MAEAESTNTMLQNSFVRNGDGDYFVKVATISFPGSATTVKFSQTGTDNTVKLDQTDPNNKVRIADGQIITIAEPLASRATSVFANGKQAAPAANTTIALTADLSTGTWDIEARISIAGTTVANVESDNIKFKIGASTVATPTMNVPGTTGTTSPTIFRARVNLGVATPVSIASGGTTATVGSIYVADIVATKWENP